MQKIVRWRSDWLDGAVVGSFLGTPWSNKGMQIRQRETTHEICCLAAQFHNFKVCKGDFQGQTQI